MQVRKAVADLDGLIHHDLENLTVGLQHAVTGQGAKIGDRGIDAVFNDAFVTAYP